MRNGQGPLTWDAWRKWYQKSMRIYWKPFIKTIVIFDDYYTNTETEVEGVGCQTLIDHLNADNYEVQILEPMDTFTK